MSGEAERQRRYVQRLDEKLKGARGNRCEGDGCSETGALEWAHVKHTGVQGTGRGRKRRLLDVQRNPDCYLLLCPDCHSALDGTNYNRHYVAKEEESEPLPF